MSVDQLNKSSEWGDFAEPILKLYGEEKWTLPRILEYMRKKHGLKKRYAIPLVMLGIRPVDTVIAFANTERSLRRIMSPNITPLRLGSSPNI